VLVLFGGLCLSLVLLFFCFVSRARCRSRPLTRPRPLPRGTLQRPLQTTTKNKNRFANPIFSAWWNRHYVSNVQITFKEDFGTQGR
jgi:hypothetical protein